MAGRAAAPYSGGMKNLLPIAVLLALGLGCDPTDTDSPADTDTGPEARGVQVGSEGLLAPGCEVRTITADTVLPGFAASVGEVVTALTGNLEAGLDGPDGQVVGSLSLRPGALQAVEGDGCDPELIFGLDATLDLLPSVGSDLEGAALVGPSLAGRMLVGSPLAEGTLQTRLDTLAFDDIWLVADGTLDAAGFTGALSWQACDTVDCSTDPIGPLVATRP
jgi:hypothetical protein